METSESLTSSFYKLQFHTPELQILDTLFFFPPAVLLSLLSLEHVLWSLGNTLIGNFDMVG